ncbi:MAG TPA: hypothetical protein VK072_02410 [Candidatus Avamphibacillus sp.]|nr:hypothetical protein [Candidatus Avamphibacillus sp.]
MNAKNVVFPDELLENKKIETTIFTEENDLLGVAVLSEVADNSIHVLRIYQMFWFNEEKAFSPVQELAAFSFPNREELDDFLMRLPEISGLEMLMLVNPLPDPAVH